MTRFRDWRGWVAAFVLLPAAAFTIGISTGTASGAQTQGGPATFAASSKTVKPNEKVTFRGRFRPVVTASAGDPQPTSPVRNSVKIQFKAFGAEFWRDARRTRAAKSGRFSERIEVERSGRFRAVSADGRTTKPKKVRVRSITTARVESNAKVGQTVAVRGRVSPAGTRRKVTVQVAGDQLHTWTDKSGTFVTKWKPRAAGTSKVRVRAAGNLIAAGSKAKAGKISVFRPAEASYYGPGLYGNGVACGGTLTTSTIGVAHKTLPCGTKLTIRYHGREATAKVIDRGPYIAGREFDLTEALRNKLGFGGVGTILVDR
jgi:3D (Asp-Asp-Asp) domain-containing protein